MLLNLITVADPAHEQFLRTPCVPVTVFNEEVREFAANLIESMYHFHGFGLAAPQVERNWNMFVMMTNPEVKLGNPIVMINPTIVKVPPTPVMETEYEACLSVPGYRGTVERYHNMLIEYRDVKGSKHRKPLEGLVARIFQHEFDHLKGVLYTDLAVEMFKKQ